MKHDLLSVCAGLLFAMMLVSPKAHSETIVAFKDSDGVLTNESRSSVAQMRRDAARNGTIRIWVSFDMEFQGNPELRTLEVIQSESQIRQWHIGQVIEPLVAAGYANIIEPSEALQEAPGCLLVVTVQGLNEIVRSSEIHHISYFAK